MATRYPYPEDEFDLPADSEVPHGAHRAPKSKWRNVWMAIAVIALAGALGYGAATYVPRWLGMTADEIADTIGITPTATDDTSAGPDDSADGSTPDDSTDADQDEPADGADDADADTDADADGGDDADGVDSDDAITDDEPDSAPAALEKDVAIRVLNATRTSGLAARATTSLQGDGWSDLTADNYTGSARVQSSVVYFKSADFRDEAEAIAEVLGINSTLEVPALVGPISVILASDFTG